MGGITQFDKAHTPENFLNKIAQLEARIDTLERRFVSLDRNFNLSLPSGLTIGTGALSFGEPTTVEINAGDVTFIKSYMLVDTANQAAADNLDVVFGGSNGDLMLLRALDSARTVTCRDESAAGGNLHNAAGNDFDLNHTDDVIMYVHADGHWLELERSSNSP